MYPNINITSTYDKQLDVINKIIADKKVKKVINVVIPNNKPIYETQQDILKKIAEQLQPKPNVIPNVIPIATPIVTPNYNVLRILSGMGGLQYSS